MVKGAGREVAGLLLLLLIFFYEALMPLCLIVTPSVSDADSLLFDDMGEHIENVRLGHVFVHLA